MENAQDECGVKLKMLSSTDHRPYLCPHYTLWSAF